MPVIISAKGLNWKKMITLIIISWMVPFMVNILTGFIFFLSCTNSKQHRENGDAGNHLASNFLQQITMNLLKFIKYLLSKKNRKHKKPKPAASRQTPTKPTTNSTLVYASSNLQEHDQAHQNPYSCLMHYFMPVLDVGVVFILDDNC